MNLMIYLVLSTQVFHVVFSFSAENTTALINRLLSKYDKRVRPLKNQTQVLTVNIGFSLVGIIEFDEVAEKLETAGFLTLTWMDDYLTWNRTTEGIDYIKIPESLVWTPGLLNSNSLKKMKIIGDGARLVAIRFDGLAIFMPGDLFGTGCSVDVTYFPYDKQNCPVKFAPWNYLSFEVVLKPSSESITMDVYEENSGWDVTGTSSDVQIIAPDESNENFTVNEAVFSVSVKRRIAYHVQASIIPTVLLTILSCFVFLLPAESGEKVSYVISLFLTLAVYITFIASNMPQTSKTTSIFLAYLTITLFLIGVSVLISIVSVYASGCKSACTMPGLFRKILIKIKRRKAKGKAADQSSSDINVTWHDFTAFLDLVCFVLSAVFVVVMNISVLCVLSLS